MKTLYIIAKGMGKLPKQKMVQLEKNGEMPRFTYLEKKLKADLLDERLLREEPSAMMRTLFRYIPVPVAQIIKALRIHRQYDLILSQSEKVAFPLALIMKIFRVKTPHVIIISRITSIDSYKSKLKQWYLKQVKNSVSRFLIWSSNQRKIAIEQLGVDPAKIVLIKRGTDQKFWVPIERETDMICSVGMEARDYPTLVEALKPLSIPCHIAAGEARGEIFETVKKLYNISEMPEHITIGQKNYTELRELYARSRFVVVSLLPTDSDNGLTTILESMAMAKPVICTRAEGQVDIIEDGVTGLMVPQGDPIALGNAISELWNNPERCKQMGMAGRRFIETHHSLEQFSEAIIREAKTVVLERKIRRLDSDIIPVRST